MDKKTVHINSRISQENYLVLKDIADTLFRGPDEVIGNFTDALNYVVDSFRLQNSLADTLYMIRMHAEYERGIRTKEVINAENRFRAYIASVARLEI